MPPPLAKPTRPSWLRGVLRLEVLIGFYLIIAGLILVPVLLWVENTIAQALVAQKITEIKQTDQTVAQLLSARIEMAEASIQRFAHLLSSAVLPAQPEHSAAFDQVVQQDPDGAWRSIPAHFTPTTEAGIWVPRIGVLNADLKSFYIQAKGLTEQYGAGALNPTFVNTWILPATNGEVIFWPDVPDFIYAAGPDFDYTGTDWVNLVRPEVNPAGKPAWTPTSFDPVPAIWMISIIAPYTYQNQWAGSVGHDMPVGNVFRAAGQLSQIEGSRFFLVAPDGTLLISDRYQTDIEQTQGGLKIADLPEPELNQIFPTLLQQITDTAVGEVLQLETANEILIVSRVGGPGWVVVNAIPRATLTALIRQPFSLLRGVVLLALGLMLVASVFSIWQEGLRRRRREQEIRQMNVALEQRVNERTAELARRVEQLDLINRVVRSATSLVNQDELLPTLAGLIREAFDYYAVLILLIDKAAGVVRLRAAATAADMSPLTVGNALPIDETSMIGYVAKTGQPLAAGDVHLEPRYHYHAKLAHTQSELVLPLRIGAELVGVLDLESAAREAFSAEDVQVLQTLADHIAIVIHNAGLFEAAQNSRLEAEKANRAKSDFLANMSHELRTPLNGILGYAQILKRQKDLSPQQAEGIEIIYKSGDHLLTLINDVLDLAKIEANRFDLLPVDFNLAAFLRDLNGLIHSRVDQKDIVFKLETLTTLPTSVYADEKRLRQVALNLLSNAVKFTVHGTVTLRVGVVNAEHQLRAYIPGEPTCRIRFEVQDSGPGLSPETQQRLFKPFEQAGDLRQRAEGTGLGLAISRQLVQAMGGEIGVASQLGQGSVFWFEVELPSTQTVAQTLSEGAYHLVKGYLGPRRKILVVDDKAHNRAVLVNLLTPLGFELAEAQSGPEGVAQAQVFVPDLVFMDIVMQGMSGHEAAQLIRQLPGLAQVPIIAASASVFETERYQTLLAGCDDFIAKPIEVPKLFGTLKRWLNLEWEYEAVEAGQLLPTQAKQPEMMVMPPPAELNVLRELAQMGDIGGLKDYTEQLAAKNDPAYQPLVVRLQELVKNFDTETILELVEKHLKTLNAASAN